MLENKLGIMDSAELAREEERLSKKRAKELFEKDLLAGEPAGKFSTLQKIHKILFADIYPFAGQLRTVNLAKGNFRFCIWMRRLRTLTRCRSRISMRSLKNMWR